MKKWECLVCGWVYDEALGWPDDGIEPGTKWEDIPNDWACPECGVGKEDFEMIEIKEPSAASENINQTAVVDIDPVIIIGSGLAAYNLTKEFRKLDKTTPVIMISRDDGNLYYKPNLSCGLTNKKTPDELIMSLRKSIELDLSVSIKPYAEVKEIDSAAKKIKTNAEILSYSKLVIATGAGAIKLPIMGDGVHSLNSINDLLDYRKYRDELVGKSKVAIIGAGLIGCEFTNDLLNHGVEVEVIDGFGQCMPNLLPLEASKAVEAALNDKGAIFHFNSKVTSVDKTKMGYTIGLEGGKDIEADLVISAVGLQANKTLAESSGIDVGRGITVNRYLETSAPDVYALGDCADVEGQLLMYVEPLILSAKALAKTLAGDRSAVDYKVMAVTVKTPACPVVVACPPQNIDGEWDITVSGNDVEALFRDETGEVVGFALTGKAVEQKKELEKALPKLI